MEKFRRFLIALVTGMTAAGLAGAGAYAQEAEPLEGLFSAPAIEVENKSVNLGSEVNTEYSDFGPVISADGNFLYLTSDRPGGQGGQDFWVSERKAGVWQKAQNLGPPVNTAADEGPDSFSIAEDALYFTACNRPDSLGGCDIYLTRKTREGWTNPVNLGRPINSQANEVNATIDAVGLTLVFASDRTGGMGDYDLWIAHRVKNPLAVIPLLPDRFSWGAPINLGPAINSPGWEGVGFLHPGGKTLYFSSTGRSGLGKADIFKSGFADGRWSEAKNMGEIINTPRDDIYFSLPGSGELAYFSSDMRGGMGREDIYSISLPFLMQQRQVFVVRGVIRDGKTGKGISAEVSIRDPKTDKDLGYTESDPETGGYQVILCHPEVNLTVKAKKHQPYTESLALTSQAKMLLVKDIVLEPLSE